MPLNLINCCKCGMIFGGLFSIKFRDLLNLLNCNKYDTITFFYISGHLLFASTFHQHFMLFQEPFAVSFFYNLFWFCTKLIDWGPFKTQWPPTWHPKSTKWHQSGLQRISPELPKCGRDLLMRFGRPLAYFWHHLDLNEHQNVTKNQHLPPKC